MARKIYITGEMSIDEQLAEIADIDPVAALMWPWILTAFDDWARANASPRRLKTQIFPANQMVTVEKIAEALQLYHDHGLITLYEIDGKQFAAIDTEKWWSWQTHIKGEKKERDGSHFPAPSEGRLQLRASASERKQTQEPASECAENPASPHLVYPPSPRISLPPSPLSPPSTSRRTAKPSACVSYSPEFEEFWNSYPRKLEKKGAFRCWQTRRKEGFSASSMLSAAENYSSLCQSQGTEEKYVKHPTTFIGPDRPFEEYCDGTPEEWATKGRESGGNGKKPSNGFDINAWAKEGSQ